MTERPDLEQLRYDWVDPGFSSDGSGLVSEVMGTVIDYAASLERELAESEAKGAHLANQILAVEWGDLNDEPTAFGIDPELDACWVCGQHRQDGHWGGCEIAAACDLAREGPAVLATLAAQPALERGGG